MQRLWPSDRLISATEFTQNLSLKEKKNESINWDSATPLKPHEGDLH